jgi:fluoroacetyl-CoA thioesterase
MRPTLQPGLTGHLEYLVQADRTVPHLLPEAAEFSDTPHVLATGYLVGLVEWTCMRALLGHLDEGERTLGVHVDLSHETPTPPGSIVTFDVELTAISGRQLTFAVHAADDAAVVCRGTHRRAVIDRERFEHKLSARSTTPARPKSRIRASMMTATGGSAELGMVADVSVNASSTRPRDSCEV